MLTWLMSYCRDLTEVKFWYLPGGTEETRHSFSRDSRCANRDSKPALPEHKSAICSVRKKLTVAQLVEECSAFYRTQIKGRQRPQGLANCLIRSKFHPIHILIPIYLRWYHPPSGLRPSAFPSKVLNAFSFHSHATCGAHLFLLYFSVQTVCGENPVAGFSERDNIHVMRNFLTSWATIRLCSV
jgi:hypothetical protein